LTAIWRILAALAVLAIPAGRRLLRARVAPLVGQVIPRLLEVVQQPDEVARIESQRFGERLLSGGTVVAQQSQCNEVARS